MSQYLIKIYRSGPAWRWFFILLLGLFLLLLAYYKVVPSGKIIYERSWPRGLASGQGFILDFRPGERLDNQDPKRLVMIGDPLYFSVFTPRTFDQAKVSLWYQNRLSEDTPVLELGVLKNKNTAGYDLQPLNNQIINQKLAEWSSLPINIFHQDQISQGNKLLLLQAEPYYNQDLDFWSDLQAGQLKDCPSGPATCLALYNYSWPAGHQPPFLFRPPAPPQVLSAGPALRGPHQFYVYFPAGDWQLDFSFAHILGASQKIAAQVKVWSQGHLISEGGSEADTGALSLAGKLTAAEILKVDINIDEQTLIKKWQSSSDYLVFINRLWLDSNQPGQTLFTDASYLQLKAYETEDLGRMSWAGREFVIDQTHRQFNFFLDADANGGAAETQAVQPISLSGGGLILETKGVFSLAAETLFNPDFKTVNRFFNHNRQIKYILTSYQPPLGDRGDRSGHFFAQADFDLRSAWRESGHYSFLISVPGLGADTPGSNLEITKIRVELSGRSLLDKLKVEINKLKSFSFGSRFGLKN